MVVTSNASSTISLSISLALSPSLSPTLSSLPLLHSLSPLSQTASLATAHGAIHSHVYYSLALHSVPQPSKGQQK